MIILRQWLKEVSLTPPARYPTLFFTVTNLAENFRRLSAIEDAITARPSGQVFRRLYIAGLTGARTNVEQRGKCTCLPVLHRGPSRHVLIVTRDFAESNVHMSYVNGSRLRSNSLKLLRIDGEITCI